MSSETFLSRWSRRKQEVRKTEEPVADRDPAPGVSTPPETTPDRVADSGAGEPLAGSEPELSAEDLAKLPSLEELTAETDISMFLRRGVPEPLRNAALRRMWSLDPKIRDFVSEAREYAYDWNTPGGVPGFGPLEEASEDVARMAARIVGGDRFEPPPSDAPRASAEAPSNIREQPSHSDVAGAQTAAATEQENHPGATLDSAEGEADDRASAIAREPQREVDRRQESASATQQSATDGATIAAPRRHGGAMPV